MIQSMTAFARMQSQGDFGLAICEMRSINHRYLDVFIRLPEQLQALESAVRERIRQKLQRGKVECIFRYHPSESTSQSMQVNYGLAKELCCASESIAALLKVAAPTDTMRILQWPGVLQIDELDVQAIQQEIINLVEKALQELIDTRAREGAELKLLFLQRLENMKVELAKVRKRMPDILKAQRERLIKRFSEAKLDMEEGRLEQEMILFSQRSDVTEELDRLDAHISEVRRVLKEGGVIGRRMDFLMQELHREANTLGAKSVDVDTTRASVELKVLIEQMREQVQNVE
jgi:uncharacterized protein (TIGR00255 family)